MTQAHPTLAVAATKLPKERLAQLDRLAQRRGMSRSGLLRQAIDALLSAGDEPLTPLEKAAVERREREAHAMRRLAAINQKLKRPSHRRMADR